VVGFKTWERGWKLLVRYLAVLPKRGLWRGVALLVLQFPLPKLPARREISNAIVLGFALRTDRSYDLRFNSRVAFWACVEMREWWRVKALFGKGVARFGGGKSQMLQPQRLRKVC
jgi:hypothetical protein